jgi:hypothetical protein
MITININTFLLSILLAVIFIALFHFVSFTIKKNSLVKVKKGFEGELHKLADISIARMKCVAEELTEFQNWLNISFPADLANVVYTEAKLLKWKDKARISDKDYLEAFEPVIMDLQKIISARAQKAADTINEKLMEDLKGLTNDRENKKDDKEQKNS